MGYIDLTKETFPELEDEDATKMEKIDETVKQPQYRLVGKRDYKEVIFKGDTLQDEWYADEDLQLLVRFHRQPQDWLFSPDEASANCPIEQEN